jgi:Peptidase A4 family
MRRLLLLGVVAAVAVAGSGTAGGGGLAAAGPVSGKLRTGRGTIQSTNWSGYAAYGTTFTDVKGSWTQPSADCLSVKNKKTTIAAFWVGLDGYKSNTVEQTGSEADCSGKTPVYFAWYEFYPANLVVLPSQTYPVVPGDTLTAEVSQDGTTVHLKLDSDRPSWPNGGFTASMSAARLDFSSAEWIAEAPSHSLTDFDHVAFSSSTASDASNTDMPISSWINDEIILIDHPGPHATTRADPSALETTGDAFSIDWKHS